MKRHLVLAALALFTVLALPVSAQYWGAAGSTGIVDEASAGLYEVTGGSLQFKAGQTGTIVARYPVGGHAVLDPAYEWMVSSHAGPGVTVKLYGVLSCSTSNNPELFASVGPSTGSDCINTDVSSIYWDALGYSYFVEVTLTRSSTATNPQFHHVQLQQW
jgi:hypothetical protein